MISRLTILAVALAAAGPAVLAADTVPVTASRLQDLAIDRELRAPATVVSANEAVVTSQVSALISSVVRDVGSDVRKGDLLIRLDDANARLALAQAEAELAGIDAQLAEAHARLAKAEELLAKNFISDDEMISRRSAVAVLEASRQAQLARIELAGLDLARTRIKAPFDAAIVARSAQVGSYAQPGTPLITLVQTDSREIDVEVDPRYASNVPAASNFRFVSQGQEWPAELARISSVVDTSSRLVRARFTFTDAPAPIGTSGDLVWSELSGLVPVNYIVARGDSLGVFIANSNIARFVPIPGAQQGRPAIVDLPPGSLIIIRGHTRLQDGNALQVTLE